jgi:hypothetical protein
LEEASGDGNGGGFGGPEEVLHRLSSVGEEVRIRELLMSTQRAYFVINYMLIIPCFCIWFPCTLYLFLGSMSILPGPDQVED